LNIFRDIDPQPRRSLLILFTAGLLFWSSLASLLPTLPLYVQFVGGTKQQIGFVMGAFAIGLLLSRPPLGKIADTRGRKQVLLLGAVVAAIAPLGYLLAQSIPLLLLIRVFHGISIAAFTTAYSALVTDLSPPGKRLHELGESYWFSSWAGYWRICASLGWLYSFVCDVGGFRCNGCIFYRQNCGT
jgi:MFS family permease